MEIQTDTHDSDLYVSHRGIDGGPRWEISCDVTCDSCDSDDVLVSRDGSLYILNCEECFNKWSGSIERIITTDQDTGEITITDWSIAFSHSGYPNKY